MIFYGGEKGCKYDEVTWASGNEMLKEFDPAVRIETSSGSEQNLDRRQKREADFCLVQNDVSQRGRIGGRWIYRHFPKTTPSGSAMGERVAPQKSFTSESLYRKAVEEKAARIEMSTQALRWTRSEALKRPWSRSYPC